MYEKVNMGMANLGHILTTVMIYKMTTSSDKYAGSNSAYLPTWGGLDTCHPYLAHFQSTILP